MWPLSIKNLENAFSLSNKMCSSVDKLRKGFVMQILRIFLEFMQNYENSSIFKKKKEEKNQTVIGI